VAIAARWRPLENLPAPRGRERLVGVYELADAERAVIYIGQSATDVPNRIRTHLRNGGCVAERACFWRMAASRVPQAEEARLLAAFAQAHGHLPPCNRATPQPRDALRRYRERSGGH
jgi:hypothetical protein